MLKIISKSGSFLSCALHMYENGEKLKVYIDEEPARGLYKGLLPKASDIAALDISPKDIVIIDMVGFGDGANVLKQKGITVIGAGKLADKMELDRNYGLNLMNQSGIKMPPGKSFNSFQDAAAFVSKTKKRYVFKPNGNLSTSLTYVSTSTVNLLAMFPYLEKQCKGKADFELQEFIPGIEMSTEAWFNGERFVFPINSTMEEKKLFPGNSGPNTGCMGNVVWFWDSETSNILYEKMFKALEPGLKKDKYVGPIDINAIWAEDGIYGLEYTARFGYDAIQAFDQLLTVPMEIFLKSLKGIKELPVEPEKYAVAIRVSIPPYPHSTENVPEIPILGITKNIKRNLYLSDIKLEEGNLCTGGYDGDVLTIADSGNNLKKITSHLYGIIDILEIPNKQYRNDIGDRVPVEKSQIEKYLKKL